MSILESVILISLANWFLFYVLNHATLLSTLRGAVGPLLPSWLKKALTCPLCLCWWIMCALTLFTGYIAPLVACPPLTLFCELAYQRLKGKE